MEVHERLGFYTADYSSMYQLAADTDDSFLKIFISLYTGRNIMKIYHCTTKKLN